MDNFRQADDNVLAQVDTLFTDNGETMFRSFALSVGVANIRAHLSQLAHRPRWLCEASHFDGFVAMADRLLAAHQGDSKRT